jgi:hypothetical protein
MITDAGAMSSPEQDLLFFRRPTGHEFIPIRFRKKGTGMNSTRFFFPPDPQMMIIENQYSGSRP